MSKTPRHGAYIVQARGSSPVMLAENMSFDYDNIRSMETGNTLQMMHHYPQGIILPTGFPTSNPGARRLWLNNNVLTMGT